jgi:hypothetical protein
VREAEALGVFYGRLVPSGTINGTKHHEMTGQRRPPSLSVVHDACLRRTSRGGPQTVILRLPLLQRHHRRLANPATGAAHAQQEREEAQASDEPRNVLTQLLTPYHGFPWLVSACLPA